jgi:hypothetical protein
MDRRYECRPEPLDVYHPERRVNDVDSTSLRAGSMPKRPIGALSTFSASFIRSARGIRTGIIFVTGSRTIGAGASTTS